MPTPYGSGTLRPNDDQAVSHFLHDREQLIRMLVAAVDQPPREARSFPIGRYFWFALLALSAALTGVVVVLTLASAEIGSITSEVGQVVCYLFAMASCLWVSFHMPRSQVRWAWRCIGLACACNAVGESIYGYLVVVGNDPNPFPSLADIFYLLFFPLMTIGIALLPARSRESSLRWRAFIDGGVAAIAIFGIGWNFLIGPIFFHGGATPLQLMLSVAYPLGDLIIVTVLVVQLFRGTPESYRSIFFLLTIAMFSGIYADLAFTYLDLQGGYTTGFAGIDPFWMVGALGIALAPVAQYRRFGRAGPRWDALWAEVDEKSDAARVPSVFRLVIPYLPLVALIIVRLIFRPDLPMNTTFFGVELSVFLVFLLIAIRQLVALQENAVLTQQQGETLRVLQAAYHEIDLQRQQIEDYALSLEQGVRRIQDVQERVSQGDYAARVQGSEDEELYPMMTMLNRLLDRFENRTIAGYQGEQLSQLVARMEQISQRIEYGEWGQSARDLPGFAQTPLAQTARTLHLLTQRGTPGSGHPSEE